MSDNNQEKRIENLEEMVAQLSKMLTKSFSYANQDPDTFLQNARKTTEAICRFIYLKELGEPKGKMMLNDYGRELLNKKIIPDRMGILIGTIQTYGNYASHAQKDLSETTQEWITPCQSALASLTNWFFLEYLNGKVPDELVAPVKNYGESNKEKKGAGKRKGVYAFIVTVFVLTVIAFFYQKNNESDRPAEVRENITTDSTIVKQQDELVNKLNESTVDPNAKRIAILYFDNGSEDSGVSMLRKGLADMMISDLAKVKMLNVIERARIEDVLKEQQLSNSKEFDPSTAVKLGKLLGVQYILTGAFFDLMGSLRIDARIIEVETGKILKSEGVNGATSSFFNLQKELVIKLASGLNVDLLAETGSSSSPEATLSYEESLLYSKALDWMDKGETTKAIEAFKAVIAKSPGFKPAQKMLDKLSPQV